MEDATCSVDGCDRPQYARSYCYKHYKRWWKHGDPTWGGTEWGAPISFVKGAINAKIDLCIIFPFYRNKDGYGWMRVEGKNIGSHVYAATLAHGPKPSPEHEACHSCGNGHAGCVNPRHIYWGTRSDNTLDAYRHGRRDNVKRRTGEAAPAARYSDNCIAKVREALANGEPQKSISQRFGVSQSHVSRIKHGATRQP